MSIDPAGNGAGARDAGRTVGMDGALQLEGERDVAAHRQLPGEPRIDAGGRALDHAGHAPRAARSARRRVPVPPGGEGRVRRRRSRRRPGVGSRCRTRRWRASPAPSGDPARRRATSARSIRSAARSSGSWSCMAPVGYVPEPRPPVERSGGLVETAPYRDPTVPVDARLDDLLARMTLDEKLAQIGCVWSSRLLADGVFDPASRPPASRTRHRPRDAHRRRDRARSAARARPSPTRSSASSSRRRVSASRPSSTRRAAPATRPKGRRAFRRRSAWPPPSSPR